MAFVDENSVAEAMRILLGGTGLTFKAEEAEDESVDASVEVLLNGHPTDFSIQVGGGYVGLNESLYSDAERQQFYASRHCGTWGVGSEDMRYLAQALYRRVFDKEMA